jgi:GntR family transcriptional regulator/MocR family aminotransferase
MARAAILLAIDDDDDGPRFAAIARSVIREIRRGRLRPGDRVPGTRELATQLGVHRNTVIAAYRDLEAQGWIATARGKGTYVAQSLDLVATRRAHAADPDRVGFSLPPLRLPPPAARAPLDTRAPILLDSGLPDPRLLPAELVARAYRRVLRRSGLLAEGDPQGSPALRTAIAASVSAQRAVPCTADDILVTRGSQQAIDLVARALVRPGDVAVVEALGYRPAWDALRLAGAELVPIAVDRDGLDTTALARVLERRKVRLVYVTPHHQYPTLAPLSAARRLALLELARAHRFAILEDDYDHEFHYGTRPVAPLRSLDAHGVVIYVGTLSKVLAPGLRTGWAIAPRPLVHAMTQIRRAADRQGDLPLEAALAELFDDDTIGRHIRRMRRIHFERQGAAIAALQRHLPDAVTFVVPKGGMALWLDVDPAIDVEAWVRAAARRGVAIAPGSAFTIDGVSRPNLRLGYCRHTPAELERGIARLAAARPRQR